MPSNPQSYMKMLLLGSTTRSQVNAVFSQNGLRSYDMLWRHRHPPTSFSRPVKILVADDHALIRKMVTATLKEEPGFDVIGEAEDGQQAVDKAEVLKPDVVVLNIKMPGSMALKLLAAFAKIFQRLQSSHSFERSG